MSHLFGGYFEVDEYNGGSKEYEIKKISSSENTDLIKLLDDYNIDVDIENINIELSNGEQGEEIILDKSILEKNDTDEFESNTPFDKSILLTKPKKCVSFDLDESIIINDKVVGKGAHIHGGKKEYSDGYSPYESDLISDMISKKMQLI